MFYRLVINVNFSVPPPSSYLATIRDYIEAQSITINSGQPNAEFSSYQYHRCYHDDEPAKPCELLAHWRSQS